jgi:2-polyprenyl-3-methyl-5-hydroxy-6-metoxy-1,4-benzoquinol methylase
MTGNEVCICSFGFTRKIFSDNFDALHCKKCGSTRFVPINAVNGNQASEFHYGRGNQKYTEEGYLYGKELRWAHLMLLKQDWSDRKVLEIGCFNGFFLEELRIRGADVYGFDVNQEAVAVGSELFGLTHRLDVSLNRLAAQGPFDDILCIDVLEHLDQPDRLLCELHALIRPGGRLLVAGPTTERRFHDKSDFPPHHKWWFSRPGLHSLLQRHEFEVISISVQRDGMLLLRNAVGRVLAGLHKKEFYGETTFTAPSTKSAWRRVVYAMLSALGTALFTLLRVSYCSAIFIARKRNAP